MSDFGYESWDPSFSSDEERDWHPGNGYVDENGLWVYSDADTNRQNESDDEEAKLEMIFRVYEMRVQLDEPVSLLDGDIFFIVFLFVRFEYLDTYPLWTNNVFCIYFVLYFCFHLDVYGGYGVIYLVNENV